jgi:protein OS-9
MKEVSTCSYLMVIQTSRLCKDVAFQPPQTDDPNPVSCYPILAEDEVDEYKNNLASLRAADARAKAAAAAAVPEALLKEGAASLAEEKMVLVGDIVLGARQIIPQGYTIEKSAIVGGGKETYVDTLVTSNGPRVLNKAQLEKLGVKSADQIRRVELLQEQLERAANGRPWRLEVFDTPRGRQFVGIHGDEGPARGDEDNDSTKNAPTKEHKDDDGTKARKNNDVPKAKQAATTVVAPVATEKNSKKNKKEQQEGSEEEFFRQEL